MMSALRHLRRLAGVDEAEEPLPESVRAAIEEIGEATAHSMRQVARGARTPQPAIAGAYLYEAVTSLAGALAELERLLAARRIPRSSAKPRQAKRVRAAA